MTAEQPGLRIAPEDEVVELCRDLIRIPTVNTGGDDSQGERAAAEYVMASLHEVGLDPVLVESRPGRASVMVRIEGADPSLPGLVVHGHLDVVPADAADWQVDRSRERSATAASGGAAPST